ncbi:hypothetical protein RUND412_009397 [Rhizina undulata]
MADSTPNNMSFVKVYISMLIFLAIHHLYTMVLSFADRFDLSSVQIPLMGLLALMIWYLVSLCSNWLRRRDQQLSPQAVNNVAAVDQEADMTDRYLTSAGEMEVGMASGQTELRKLKMLEAIMAEVAKRFEQEQLNQRYRRRYN